MLFADKIKSGIYSLLRDFRIRIYSLTGGNCAILLYHRVTELESDPQSLSVSPTHFDAQLSYLKKNFRVLSVDEWQECLISKKRFPSNSVLITFDDGYADNFHYALPILEKHGVQALFYICTGNLNTNQEFWWDELERIILLNKKFPDYIELDTGKQILQKNANESVEDFYLRVLPVFRNLAPDIRDRKISEFAKASGNPPPRESHRSLTFMELVSLSKSPSAVIGAHTHRHASLASLEIVEQRKEIEQSLNILNAELSLCVKHFSYPFGTKVDYNENSIKVCKELGLEWVTANFPWITHKRTDRFQIPRFLVRDWGVDRFAVEMMKNFS